MQNLRPTTIARFFIQPNIGGRGKAKVVTTLHQTTGFTGSYPDLVSTMFYDKSNAVGGLQVNGYLSADVENGAEIFGHNLSIRCHDGCVVSKHRAVFKLAESTIKKMEKHDTTNAIQTDHLAYLRLLFDVLNVKSLYFEDLTGWRSTSIAELDSFYEAVLKSARGAIGVSRLAA